MSKTFQLDIVTPAHVISEGQVEYLRAPSTEGLFGIMGGHAVATILMDIGEIKVTKDGITLDFIGKEGVRNKCSVHNAKLARNLRTKKKTLHKIFDQLFTNFPFEDNYFNKYKLNTKYIGHPIFHIKAISKTINNWNNNIYFF